MAGLETGKSHLIFAGLSLWFLGTAFLWLRLDRTPPSWDDAFYLTNSLAMFDAPSDGGLAGYASKFLTIMRIKPPLIVVLPTPVYLLAGRRPHAAYVLNLLWLLVMFAALYRLRRKYSSRRTGLLAVYIAGTMPVVYGLARWYLVECGLMAIVCATILLLAESDGFENASKPILLGTNCGLGLLMKISFPVYVLVPMIYFAMRARRTALRRKTVLAFAVPAALLTLPWYLFNFRRALKIALLAGSAQRAMIWSPDIWTIRS
jgi:4-amino-4-deoxy-L-arabinose transferase-like glycosyltransferase